jgi:hypothetical protein
MKSHATQHRAPGLASVAFLLVGLAVANYPAHAQTLDSPGTHAISTHDDVKRG